MHGALATTVSLGHTNIFASVGFVFFLLGVIVGFIIARKVG